MCQTLLDAGEFSLSIFMPLSGKANRKGSGAVLSNGGALVKRRTEAEADLGRFSDACLWSHASMPAPKFTGSWALVLVLVGLLGGPRELGSVIIIPQVRKGFPADAVKRTSGIIT